MKIVKYALIIILVILIGGFLYFMNRTPASPFKIEEFVKDSFRLEVNYSRPYKKNRLIFGSETEALVPYGKYWRLGADAATTFESNLDINFGGTKINSGKYRMYAVPNENSWKITLNSEPDKFGYFEPNYDKDVISIDVPSQPLLNSLEQFTISFEDNENGLFMIFKWDITSVTISLN